MKKIHFFIYRYDVIIQVQNIEMKQSNVLAYMAHNMRSLYRSEPKMSTKEKRATHVLDGRDKFVEDILQLLKNGSSSDVRIILEDGEILANKDVLSTRCEYFATMFSNNEAKFIEGETNSVNMSHCSKVIMEKIINYLFSGQMKFNDLKLDQLLKLMNMASLMLLDDVFTIAEDFVLGWLPDSGVNLGFLPELVSGLKLAEQFKLNAIKEEITRELHIRLKDVPHIPDFKLLPYSLVKDVFLCKKGERKTMSAMLMDSSPSTRQKFDAFMFWLSENDCGEYEKNAIVYSFKFDDFTADELLTEVRMSGLYSISMISSRALEILQKKEEIIKDRDQELCSSKALIQKLENKVYSMKDRIDDYANHFPCSKGSSNRYYYK